MKVTIDTMLSPKDLAKALNVSHNQALRLFAKYPTVRVGTRQRRMRWSTFERYFKETVA